MTHTSYIVVAVKELAKQKRYDDAVAILDTHFPDRLLCAELCVLRGNLIQLSSAESHYELGDARVMYEKALELAPDSDEAMFELGMFFLNVMDDAALAMKYIRGACSAMEKRLETAKGAADQAKAELAEAGRDEVQ